MTFTTENGGRAPPEPEQLELGVDDIPDELDFHEWMLAMQDPDHNPQIRGEDQSPARRHQSKKHRDRPIRRSQTRTGPTSHQ